MERDGSTSSDTAQNEEVEARIDGASPLEESWEGDGSVDIAPDDGEWGGEAPARNSGVSDGDETASAADLARAALEGLQRRVARFDRESTPYVSWAAPQFMGNFGGNYDHLARVWEWHVVGGEDEAPE